MDERRLVVAYTFGDRMGAELAQSALQAAGIESMVRGDDGGGTQPGLWRSEGVQVLVRTEDAQAARDVLDLPAKPVA